MTARYPAFLDLQGRHCVVVGAGRVARPKIRSLLECGGTVTVVAPDATACMPEDVAARRLRAVDSPFEPRFLDGAFLVIAATADTEVNRHVHRAATERGCLVCVVDTLPLCNFASPSVVRKGDLTVAVSTAGRAPALAATLRRRLEDSLPDGAESFLEEARFLRRRVLRSAATPEEKRTAWYDLATAAIAGPSADSRALPLSLELPIAPGEASAPQWDRLGVLAVDCLHASARLVGAVLSGLERGEADERLRECAGAGRQDGLVVLATEDRVDIVVESDAPGQALEGVLRCLADLAGTAVDDFRRRCCVLVGSPALTHLACAAAGLRSIVALEGDTARRWQDIDLPSSGLVADAVETALSVRRGIVDAGGVDDVRDSLRGLAARFLRDRIPQVSECRVAVRGADPQRADRLADAIVHHAGLTPADSPGTPGTDRESKAGLVLVLAGAPQLCREEVVSLLDAGWELVHVLDLGVPPVADAGLADLHGVSAWGIDDLAELTPVGTLPAATLEAAREIARTRIESAQSSPSTMRSR